MPSPYYYGPGYYGRYYGPGYGYYGGPAYVADDPSMAAAYWQRQRFWDGYGWRVPPRAGLRLIPFIFVKSGGVPETARFGSTGIGLKKPFFQANGSQAFTLD